MSTTERPKAWLADQINKSQKRVREQKKTTPWMFPEHTKLVHAGQELKKAQEAYDLAKAEWDKLGYYGVNPAGEVTNEISDS